MWTDQIPAKGNEDRSFLKSSMRSILGDDFRYLARHPSVQSVITNSIIYRFRILVLGKVRVICSTSLGLKLMRVLSQRGSGKSSLINAVFRVDMSVCTKSFPRSFPTKLTLPCKNLEGGTSKCTYGYCCERGVSNMRQPSP